MTVADKLRTSYTMLQNLNLSWGVDPMSERRTLGERLAVVEDRLEYHVRHCAWWQRAVFAAALTAAITGVAHLIHW